MATNLLSIVQQTEIAPQKCRWHLGTVIGVSGPKRAALAWIIANAVMDQRSGGSRAATLWRTAALAQAKLASPERQLVAAFIDGVFGLPPDGKSEEHLIGHVAEWLWYLHALEVVDSTRTVALLEPPKFNVTEPGADGFVIYEDNDTGDNSFRLWEIKQHTGASAVSKTVGDAYTQLSTNATRYLAQLTSIHSAQSGPVGDLCKQLVDFWIDNSDSAGVGVGVASARVPPPKTCFTTMGKQFPGLVQAGQLEGLLLAIEDFQGLARDVRTYLWTVL
ncbi:hypothetical protein ACFVWG_20715 [Kribbella sp. NPDC058245]|uniref:hypothetical protein n=1 Tax=Kribbella sp. NPDC058245 TaxID=3346399 RepID=UPI0036E5BE2A